MKRWERGRLVVLLIPDSWSILPVLHIGKVASVSRPRGTTLVVGWLCVQLRIRVNQQGGC